MFHRKEILRRAPRARVWRALTDAREFGIWFGVKFDQTSFVVGSHATGKIVPTTVDENVAKAQKPYEGTPFDLEEVDGGTMLTLTETGFDRIPLARRAKAFSMNEAGWTGVMALIEKYVDQRG
jgi:uncharacterized protein YndB with AHSA1/START domain